MGSFEEVNAADAANAANGILSLLKTISLISALITIPAIVSLIKKPEQQDEGQKEEVSDEAGKTISWVRGSLLGSSEIIRQKSFRGDNNF